MQVMCVHFRSRKMAIHPAAIKQVLRAFSAAFTGGRSKTFISQVGLRIETNAKVAGVRNGSRITSPARKGGDIARRRRSPGKYVCPSSEERERRTEDTEDTAIEWWPLLLLANVSPKLVPPPFTPL
jgi:hypothetical protein